MPLIAAPLFSAVFASASRASCFLSRHDTPYYAFRLPFLR
jgi:hypothetical protein